MGIATLNISLPDTMKTEVEEIIATEGYGNTSEFFRDLVRNYLKERRERKIEDLQSQIAKYQTIALSSISATNGTPSLISPLANNKKVENSGMYTCTYLLKFDHQQITLH